MANTKQKVTVSSPISILWDSILLIPIFGTVDSRKAQELMEDILTKIVETESKTIIIDILGVATVDSAVANHLVKITKATTLMGCGCIISGISPAIAQTLVHLGVELEGVITRATLKDALQWAFRTNGLEVKEVREPAVFRKKEPLS
ncbi:MAG: sigma-B regulator RsbR [Elusimicrobia bacterium RIFCSPLOWO2_01_FULL_54_10]|nr:MAG: sigma-B regulator RsbR [Elusimicrobia bacterium RIFCSPLOWO2_01_FULL_54_10]